MYPYRDDTNTDFMICWFEIWLEISVFKYRGL